MSKNKIGKTIGALGIGAALGLLFAPQSGDKTRKILKKKINELLDKLNEIDYNEVKDSLTYKVKDLQEEINDLDKEKIEKIAKDKANDIKKKADEIYKEAVKQGKPVVEKTAKELKLKAADFLRETADNIEK